MTKHGAVWIDHHEAKIFHVAPETFDVAVHRPDHLVKRHATVTAEHAHPAEMQHFFHEVAQALANVEEVLVVGPGSAKLELVKYVHKHDHALEPRIIGVETVDHPTDGQLAAHVRSYFHAQDRLRGTVP
jgi:stalled ribosome rescue protein Dom34